LDPNASPLIEANRQLALLLERQEQLAPGLYRELALYLQVLREGLLHAVQQACFHLATQVVPERYGQLSGERRAALQQRLQGLVQRCCTLLTVEQLMGLAAQQQRREQQRQRAQRQRLIDALVADQDPDPPDAASASTFESAAPQGSITLGLDLPLSADLFEAGLPGLAGVNRIPPDREDTPANPPRGEELELLQSLFAMAAEGLGQEPRPAVTDTPERPPQVEEASLPLSLAVQPELPPNDQAVTGTQLPRDPLLQLRWWAHLDQALSRRLRNLSHAVNVELMRSGLAQGLLPLNLLDAVLLGQVEVLPAPMNLLRLPLPIPAAASGTAPAEVLSLLVRSGDLEFQQPKLRTCRKRLEQRRRQLRTMAERYRYWQRRVSALEAEQQWLQDSAQPQNQADRP
jgi:hypothetical protein